MATISYVNDALPIGGLTFNPGIEEVLDPNGTIGAMTANSFEIVNNDDGPFKGFKIEFTSYVNGTGDFTYIVGPSVFQPYGTITGMWVKAPNNTVIAQILTGASGFGDAKLDHFHNTLTNPSATDPAIAISSALGNLFANADVIFGSPLADHLTNFGNGKGQMTAGAGNDVLTSLGNGDAVMAGEAGNDVFRVADRSCEIHGANLDGSGGAGETNTLEVRGTYKSSSYATIEKITDIDVLRFVDTDPAGASSSDYAGLGFDFHAGDIGAGKLSPTLKVVGSNAASPFSQDRIQIYVDDVPGATKGVSIDLSGWTFSGWNNDENYISLSTTSRALADSIVGSKVRDQIYTGGGDDVIRGGGGTDYMDASDGNDTFVFGRNEVAKHELICGGNDGPSGGTADRMLVLGDNDFSEAYFAGIDILAFGGAATAIFSQYIAGGESSIKTVQGDSHANALAVKLTNFGEGAPAVDLSDLAFTSWSANDKVTITGTKSADTISGSTQGDVIDSGLGSDSLQGNEGGDTFVFDLSAARGVDHIADFNRKEGDIIELIGGGSATFKAGDLAKSAFAVGTKAQDKNDRVIYDKKDGVLRYDDDGKGHHKAHIIAVFDDAATLKHGDILMI